MSGALLFCTAERFCSMQHVYMNKWGGYRSNASQCKFPDALSTCPRIHRTPRHVYAKNVRPDTSESMRLLQTLQTNQLPVPPLLDHEVMMRSRLNNHTLINNLNHISKARAAKGIVSESGELPNCGKQEELT